MRTMSRVGMAGLVMAALMLSSRSAVAQAKKTLIQDHLDHCLEDVVGPLPRDQRRTIDDFKAITKYL